MLRNRKRLAVLLAVLLFAALAFSALFMIAEADHDCIGEDCPVCQQIAVCAKTLELLSLTMLAVCGIRLACAVSGKNSAFAETAASGATLVSNKIKLSC